MRRTLSPILFFKALSPLLMVLIALIAAPSSMLVAESRHSKKVEDPRTQYNGKIIRSIAIRVKEIFDQPETNSFYRTANALKINTRENVIRRELTIAEGQAYDQFIIEESERNLRSLGYLTNVEIIPTVDGEFVDLEVSVRETWTFLPQVGLSAGTGSNRVTAGLVESDALGLGKRVEALYEKERDRSSIEGVYEDPRLWGTQTRLLAAGFVRDDGNRYVTRLGRPYRTLLDDDAWATNFEYGDTIGRLFENGDERYIFRQQKSNTELKYGFASGDPEKLRRRFSLGYLYQEDTFLQASQQDYDDLDLNPDEVSNDPSMLADNRRYSGPVFSYESIEPDFLPMSYIDRFERVEDYNLGEDLSLGMTLAPEALGSMDDAILFNSNAARGWRTGEAAFFRGELGIATRYEDDRLENTLARTELKFYQVFEPWYVKDFYLGRHTLAASLSLDYAHRLDKDRELLVGGDNAIRGYEAKTFTGDKRLILNLEDRMHFVDDLFQLISVGGAVFLDVGGATDDSLGDLLRDEMYSDVGIGLRLAFPRSSGGKVIRIDLAFPMRDGPDGSSSFEPRIVFAGGQLFDSQLRSENFGADKSNVEIGYDR